MLVKLVSVAGGGAVGAVMRYVVSAYAHRSFGAGFPVGTLMVNLIGSFVIGFAGGLFERSSVPRELRIFLIAGVLGGFTTFSAFSLENYHLFRSGSSKAALLNILLNTVLGIILVFAGFACSRLIAREG